MRLLPAACLLSVLSLPMATPASAEYGTQVQVFFEATSGETVRRVVKLVDPDPGSGLAFRWHPAPGNTAPLDAQGRAQGEGRVVWRLEGLSAHDPRAWHHSFEGRLQAGRLEGEGRLRWRDGREMRGHFVAGRLHGPGLTRDLHGNIIEAQFVDGQAQGDGLYRARAGWVWRGAFVDGLMQGAGQMTEAGGRQYDMQMNAGMPSSAAPSGLVAHPLIAGLRPVQGGASMADRAGISVYVDQRLSVNQWAGYMSRPDGERVFIHPANDAMIDIWEGNPSWNARMMLTDSLPEDWNDSRALVVIDLEMESGSRATLEDLSLQIEASAPHLRPMILGREHLGCTPFQPSFEFRNFGWGAVENPRMRVRFANPDDIDFDDPSRTQDSTDWIAVPVAGFDEGSDVDLRDALSALGVEIAGLEAATFPCSVSSDLASRHSEMTQCARDAVRSGLFGELAGYVAQGWGKLLGTSALAELTYDWTDFAGNVTTETRNFEVPVSLGLVDITLSMAECGAGGAWPTEARQFHDDALSVDRMDYAIDLPLRGNRTVEFLEYGVKLHAPQSSMHLFQAQARFSDGSIRLSPTTLFYFLNPRLAQFDSALMPAQCTLTMDDTGGC